jgi:uncharacterized membrane protein YcaP (DUF421 family)
MPDGPGTAPGPDVLHQVFDHPSWHGAGVIAVKTATVYVFLVAGLRLFGKRELGQMSVYDLVLIVVLGNAVQNAMINNDNTLGGGVVAATVLLLLNRALNVLIARSARVERALVGEPVVIVSDGVPLEAAMRRQGITRDELDAALREHGYESLEGVHAVILEVDGTMSVIPRQSTITKTRRHYRGLRLP